MRLVIVGLDGLDHGLAVKWGVRELLQRSHGVFDVGSINVLYTPLIWSSILCGLNVTEKGYDYEEAVRRSMGIAGALRGLKRVLGRGSLRRVARKALIRAGLIKANFRMPDHLLKESFLEIARKSGFSVKAIEVPGYNEVVNGRLRIEMHDIAPKGDLRVSSKFLEGVKSEVVRRVNEASASIGRYDLIMVYSPLPDLAHHLYCGDKLIVKVKMYGIYKWLEGLIYERLIRRAEEMNYVTLILSDHGFLIKECTHGPSAFWSLSIDPLRGIRDYRDIKPLVLKILNS